MANHKSALKRHRQSIKRRDRNRAVKSRMRTQIRKLREAIAAGDRETAAAELLTATTLLDRAAGKKVIHWRNAGRKVSRLTQAVNKMEVPNVEE